MRSEGLELALKRAGGLAALGDKLGVTRQAIAQWTEVPAHQIVAVELATGVPREVLRPDLYDKAAC